ncbi:MAG: hypothetical protein ACYDA6_02705 [Solirubrobacteraceae bacterium]
MSQPDAITQQTDGNETPAVQSGHAHGGHGWMMIACCIPMLVIAIVLVATGVAGVGFIFAAVMCTAMMAMMMRGMSHGAGQQDKNQRD